MAEIAWSTNKGRVRLLFPDEMTVDELASSSMVHLEIAASAMKKPHDPPKTGVEKREI